VHLPGVDAVSPAGDAAFPWRDGNASPKSGICDTTLKCRSISHFKENLRTSFLFLNCEKLVRRTLCRRKQSVQCAPCWYKQSVKKHFVLDFY
jgi:hypothetical protein